MQCACATLSSVPCPALQYFSTLSHKWHDFRKKKLLNIKCVLIFPTTFVWNISHSRHKWARYDKKIIGLHVQYPAFLYERNLNFLDRFRKIPKYKISWKSVQWQPMCSMLTERTDRHDEADNRFSQFWERAYKCAGCDWRSFISLRLIRETRYRKESMY